MSVFFGANDASLPDDRDHCQHVPINEYERNLREIVQTIEKKFKEYNKPPIILITPPPVDKTSWDKYCRQNFDELSPRTNEVSKLYGDRVKSVAKELGCSVCDSFSILGGNGKEETYGAYLEDGLHLNGAGNKLLFEGFIKVIQNKYPHLAPMEEGDERGIPLEGSLWKDLC